MEISFSKEMFFLGWSFWIIVAIACLILELATTSAVFLCFAVAAIVVTFIAGFTNSLELQLGCLALFSLLGFSWLKPLAQKYCYQNKTAKTNADALVGQIGRVMEGITPEKPGRVMVGGDDWRAQADETINTGATVLVVKVENNKVFVKKS
jgi:membrane protein implicated in regulation of membrane protease activity